MAIGSIGPNDILTFALIGALAHASIAMLAWGMKLWRLG
jgi:hypothetical protein